MPLMWSGFLGQGILEPRRGRLPALFGRKLICSRRMEPASTRDRETLSCPRHPAWTPDFGVGT